jgi:hypothetical protein
LYALPEDLVLLTEKGIFGTSGDAMHPGAAERKRRLPVFQRNDIFHAHQFPDHRSLLNQRIFHPSLRLLREQAMENKDERYIWEKRENAYYDIRREN